jgi:Uma2 family endonuclease
MTTILEEVAAGRAIIVPWTVERYHRAIDAGFVPENTAVELIDGILVHKDRAKAGDDPMTIGDRHRIAVLRLAQLAPAFERLGCFLQTQQPISLPPTTEPEPDAAIVRGAIDDYLERPPGPRDILAVVEVADSSLSLDSGPKLSAYASANIPQYVIVDLVNDRVLVHVEPAANAYARVSSLSRGATLELPAMSGTVPIDVGRLLP